MDVGGRQIWGAVHFLPEISTRTGEQTEKLPEFPIALSENLPE